MNAATNTKKGVTRFVQYREKMGRRKDGQWVKFEAYEKIERELAEAKGALIGAFEKLRKADSTISSLESDNADLEVHNRLERAKSEGLRDAIRVMVVQSQARPVTRDISGDGNHLTPQRRKVSFR